MNRIACLLAFLAGLSMAVSVQAAENHFQIRNADTVRTVLEQQVGKPVKLRLKSGQELGGTVARFGNGIVQLSSVSGMEFFDAVVNLDEIGAVLIRTRDR